MRVDINDYLTSHDIAVRELEERRKDPDLMRRVEAYLGGDIPDYFNGDPILYLARHVATPNFETLRFLHLTESLGMKAVIGQDTKDKFVSQNVFKRTLGKLPIYLRVTQKGGELHEQYQNVTIIDFNTANGKPFSEIRTLWGEPLVDFHRDLFEQFMNRPVQIEDDSLWIDRVHRGDLLAHYKKFLALFLAHGILFEDYQMDDPEEREFVENVLSPAFKFVESRFGVRPLIIPLTPTNLESARFWESYPQKVLEVVQERRKLKSA